VVTVTRNEGTIDRWIRFIVGLALFYVTFFTGLQPALAVLVGIVAAILVITAAVGFCPLYAALGVRTCTVQQKQ
jgi:hypothetical protein